MGGHILKLSATGAPVEQLAEVASWRLSEVRGRVLGTSEITDALYVVDAGHALPSSQLQDRISIYASRGDFDYQSAKSEIIKYSVKRAVIVYVGYWNIDKLHFVEDDKEVPDPFTTISYREEIGRMRDLAEKIAKETTVSEQRRRELVRTFQEVILPEFDRVDMKLSDISGDTKEIRRDHGALLRRIAEKLGI